MTLPVDGSADSDLSVKCLTAEELAIGPDHEELLNSVYAAGRALHRPCWRLRRQNTGALSWIGDIVRWSVRLVLVFRLLPCTAPGGTVYAPPQLTMLRAV